MAMAALVNESDFASILEDVDAERSLFVCQEEVTELTGATITTATSSRSVVPNALPSCRCRGACKTVRCPCKAAKVGCHPERCKCSTSKCSNQMESAAVNADELAEVDSGDEEPEQFCKCAASDLCNTTACYCLAIKKKKCDSARCTCVESVCMNKADTVIPSDDDDPDDADIASQVQRYCSTHDKGDVEAMLAKMATVCPHLWRSLTASPHSVDISPSHQKPSWCKCGKCYEEADPEDRVCCKNNKKNHEHPSFEKVCLDRHTLEVALVNNCDWLNMPKIYTPAKFRNTAYRQYILWFHGKLGYKNRRRIPSCIKWYIRRRYPEPDGNYVGYKEWC